jgi:CheY-like chemotaxis protein
MLRLRHEPPERDHASPVVEVSSDKRKVVLVVDDEEQVRNLTRRILERAGYRVLMAGDGPEALAISRGYPGKIHLLLTYVEMNAISGFELSHRLMAERPNIRVL